jgi:DNA (cytosine-5)-methyltransferase 1
MALILRHNSRINPRQNGLNLDEEPCPTITAGGLSAFGSYWLEEIMPDSYAPDPSKPPFIVPSMADIAAMPWNGFTAASTFSGCGGSSLGYRMAGFRVLYANEFIPAARETYRANAAPYTHLDDRDIRTVTAQSVLDLIGLKAGELDLLDGSPPCASFSTAGKREKGWGEVKKYSDSEQRSDDLFFEFARLVEGIQPKVFVAENVSGLIKGSAKGYFLEILAALKACGYRVSARLLDAQWLGVPQARQRLIFVGVRNDLQIDPVHPTPLPYRYSIRDALPWITRVDHDTSGLWSTGNVTDRPSPTITVGVNSVNSNHFKVVGAGGNGPFGTAKWQTLDEPARTIGATSGTGNNRASAGDLLLQVVEPEADISRFAIGEEWDKLKPGQMKDRKYINIYRPHADLPCPTVTAAGGASSAASVTHPFQKRKFSIAELRRICGFPDDFILTGSYAQQWERLGRAVPPVMMSHIAATVRDKILARTKT